MYDMRWHVGSIGRWNPQKKNQKIIKIRRRIEKNKVFVNWLSGELVNISQKKSFKNQDDHTVQRQQLNI